MAEVAGFLGNYTYADFPRGTGGSHIKDWDRIKYLVQTGLQKWVYIVHSETVDTAYEDTRRLRDEAHVSHLLIRLYHKGILDSADVQFIQYRQYIQHVINTFGTVTILNINEPKLELPYYSIQDCVAQVDRFRQLCKERFGNNVIISSPTINGLNPENIADYEYVCSQSDKYDVTGINFYARTVEGISQGEWSLPWFLSKAVKPCVIWEYNCPEGTDQSIRNIVLPEMHRAILRVSYNQIKSAHWFLESSDDSRLQEQIYKPNEVSKLISIFGEDVVDPVPPVIDVPTPVNWDPQEIWDYAAKKAGGPGFNEDDAFGNYVEEHPGEMVGFPIGPVLGYDKPEWLFLFQATTCGVLVCEKATYKVVFCKSVTEVPTSPF